MIAKELISDGVLPLMTSDTGTNALSWMEEYRVLHLPIVNNREFLGLISEFDLHDLTDLSQPLGHIRLSLTAAVIYEYQHVFDVLKVFNEFKLTLLPVIDENNNYIGSITLHSIIERLGDIIPVGNVGGIIVLNVDQRSLVLSEIARIVESNDARILAMFVSTSPDSTEIEVSIKIDKMDISAIMQTFTRYNYSIKSSFSQGDDENDLRKRYDALMNYLNI